MRRLPPLVLLLLLAPLSALTGRPANAGDRPPNLILILVDDLGWMDLSCQGSGYFTTPHIDRLAAEGVRFTNAYAACAVCSPTRAAVQTGRNPARLGVTDWIRARFQRGGLGTPAANPTEYVGGPGNKLLCPPNPYWMELGETTLAEALEPLGFASGYVGKWHLGDDAWYPTAQGFDENRGGCDYGQPPSYFDPFNLPDHRDAAIRDGIPGLPGRKKGEYLTHREADEVTAMIRRWRDRPFFIQYAPYAVHTPIQAIPEVTAKYRRDGKTEANARYAAMVESVDDAVARILATLEELDLDERTFIVFTSDNGGLDQNGSPTDNAPLRSGKGYAYEGGIRVPLLARWPGTLPSGAVLDTPVISMDLFPTLLAAAGGDPDDRPLDGVDLLAHLKTGGATDLERDELVWHFPHYRHAPGPYSILRKGTLKLIRFWEGPRELYDLAADPSESTDLAAMRPEVVAELEQRLDARLTQLGARLPRPNPGYRP